MYCAVAFALLCVTLYIVFILPAPRRIYSSDPRGHIVPLSSVTTCVFRTASRHLAKRLQKNMNQQGSVLDSASRAMNNGLEGSHWQQADNDPVRSLRHSTPHGYA